jgi:hypothetical protein
MKKLIALLFLFSLTLVACQDDEVGRIAIRIKNNSEYRFEEVHVVTPGGENHYGTLEPGATSGHLPFKEAYAYASVRLKIDGQEFMIMPIDYVGGKKLAKGKYTYTLTVNNYESRWMTMNCRKD